MTLNRINIILILFFIINFNQNYLYANQDGFIVMKINNEIITNLDIENEYNYLISLNNELTKLKKNEIVALAKKSIITEKVKFLELKKYYDFKSDNKDLLDNIIKNFYTKINLNSKEAFIDHLSKYNLTIDDVQEKFEIEAVWNDLVFKKYKDRVVINENNLRVKLKKKLKDSVNKTKSYFLYEILFQLDLNEKLKTKNAIIQKSINEIGFKNTANTFSQSQTSNFGGKIGWINENQLSNTFKKEIDKLKKGESSKPISTPNGYLIIKIEDIKINETKINFEEELKKTFNNEKNRQLNLFSNIFYNRIKKNLTINEY